MPEAVSRVEATAALWDRYKKRGPLQLPHELAINRIVRAVGIAGGKRYEPPILELIVAHPYAGFEFRRSGGALTYEATVAAHVGGATLWLAERRFPLSLSWVASIADDLVGHGAVLRLGELASIGYIDRRSQGEQSRRSLILHLDALKFLLDDARAKQALALFGVSAMALNGGDAKK